MLHVRFAHPLKADVFHHFHEADQAGIEQRRQSLDFGIDKVIEGLDLPLHGRYIASTLCIVQHVNRASVSTSAWWQHLSGQHGPFYGQRQVDWSKRLFRIEIILARLIDDPKQTVFLGSGIAKRDIDFTLFE
jgi:hypothetical protein